MEERNSPMIECLHTQSVRLVYMRPSYAIQPHTRKNFNSMHFNSCISVRKSVGLQNEALTGGMLYNVSYPHKNYNGMHSA